MERDGKWYRQTLWMGRVEDLECGTPERPHVWHYSGSMPCTGAIRCMYCGRYKDDHDRASGLV